MKNSEIYSTIAGGAFFAIPYLALSIPLLPSLLIGSAAFAAGELVFSKKIEEQIVEKDLKKLISNAYIQNKHIYSMIDRIDDELIKKNLEDIYKYVNNILKTIEKSPNKIKNLNNFFDYYLPATVKIIDRYDEIEDNNLSSKDSKKFIKTTNEMVNNIKCAFEKILNKLYENDMIDTDAEMKVFSSMLKMDGIDSSLLDVDKEDNNE